MRTVKRMTAVFLLFVMLLPMLPVIAFADTQEDEEILLEADGLMYVEVNGEKIYSNRFTLPAGSSYHAVYFDPADYSGLLVTEQKNSVKLTPNAGLRFATRIDETLLERLYTLLDNGDLADVTLGTLIAPTDYVKGEFTMEALEADGKAYLAVKANRGGYFAVDEDPATTHFVGSIVDFHSWNITRAFSGRGYAKITLKSGQEIVLYSSTVQSAGVKDVAQRVIDQTELYATLPEEHKAIIDTYAQGLAPDVPGREDCMHSYEITERVEPLALKDGYQYRVCPSCGDTLHEVLPATKSLKVLAIGNSFSVDAVEYLWDICNDAGVETIIIGNMYIGGCSLDTHYDNITNSNNAYRYYKNTSGKWTTTYNYGIESAIADEDWDIITVQQASAYSGDPTTFSKLEAILEYVSEKAPQADIYWHLTWAYPSNSSNSNFSKYDNDQMTMYNAIVSTYRNVVSKHEQFKGMIPSGTAIQNLRTSYIGDNLTRDTLHLDYANGRYTAAMTWYARLTGGSTEAVSWVPDAYRHVGWDLEAIREAVNNAIKTPLAVTQSKLTEAPDRLTDAEYFEKLGVDMEDYELLNWQDTVGAFYDSRRHANMISTDSISKYYSCSAFLTYEDIPVGSVIIVDEGYQYRPEGWIDASTTNSSSTRPGNVTTPAVYVTGDWWGDFTIRAFNLSKKPNADMTVADGAHLRIYVPKVKSPDADTFEQMGLDIDDYELLDWKPTVGAFYNSTSASLGTGMDTTSSNAKNFIGSVLLYKNDLPEGTVIIVDNGYQYRPEGWIDAGTKNSSATRPGNVTATATVVDTAWWGSFTIRAFNLSKTDGGSMNVADSTRLRIYVPKAESPDAATFEQMGLDVNDYELLDWQPTVGAFYNSSIASLGTGMDTTGSVATRFICSVLLYKNDLPEGAVIIVDNGYQYRPEGWIDAGTNNSSATRPGNVTTMATVVDAAWWGNFTIRAFNLSKTEGGSMNAADAVHLRIYIPKNA